MLTWLDLFPQFRMPAAVSFVQPIAPVTSWFSPTIEVNYKGNLAIEREVVTSVAGYGSQLGSLIDALVEIADRRGGPAMQRLYELKNEVRFDQGRCRPGAHGPLPLAKSDPGALREVVADFSTSMR
jgi:hypothetical protein